MVHVGIRAVWNQGVSRHANDYVIRHAKGGLRDYVFSYQLAVLALLSTLSMRGAAGLGLFEKFLRSRHHPDMYRVVAALLYTMSSFSLRG